MYIQGNVQEPPGGGNLKDGASPAARGTFASCLPMPSEGSHEEKRVGEKAAAKVRGEQERVSPHQDVKADLAAVSVLSQRGRDRREGWRVRQRKREERDG